MGTPTKNYYPNVAGNAGFYDMNEEPTVHVGTSYTSIEQIIDDSNATVDQHYSPEIMMDGYKNLAIQLGGSTGGSGVVFKIYGSLATATAPADGDDTPATSWVDMSTFIFGTGTVTLDGGVCDLYFVDTNIMVHKFIIQYECDNATNHTDIFIRRS